MTEKTPDRALRTRGFLLNHSDRYMSKGNRQKRDMHALDEHGMVVCNPRDKEAAHRAEMEGIATDNRAAVTCRKCSSLLYKLDKDRTEQE